MSEITPGKGLHMTFENGWTVSDQFGVGNRCDCRERQSTKSKTAEIAAWNSFGDGLIVSYKSPDEVLKFMQRIAAL